MRLLQRYEQLQVFIPELQSEADAIFALNNVGGDCRTEELGAGSRLCFDDGPGLARFETEVFLYR